MGEQAVRGLDSWRSAAPRVALALAGVLLCCLVGEALVRGLFVEKYAQRPSFFRFDSRLGWAPNENLQHTFYGSDFRIQIETDAAGYRIGVLGDWRSAQDLMVVSGDSYTFGWGVSNDETLVARLDRFTNEHRGGTRTVNLGVGGYGTTQSAMRLREFWREHGNKVSVLFFLHSHNDFSDNVQFAAVQHGYRRYRERSPNGSSSHLYNLAHHASRVLRRSFAFAKSDGLTKPDILFNVRTDETGLPPGAIKIGSLVVESSQFFEARQQQPPTLERKSLTALQAELMALSMADVHTTLETGTAVAMHAVIHSAPNWYVETIAALVNRERARRPRQAIEFIGRVPAHDEFHGRLENAHSGMHFTPELNEYYAAYMSEKLQPQ